ncbi:ribosome maturation factor RimM [Dermabacter sp. p3-SID358]|uniref:ribosome maturation factor RimM n=1 Tax=Dermabacter sp. p3-SID358 TaxID=2916114 RepID=UPI0021A717FE|nr:ribosome maturation factor RimM [Dermabacter sp. p3-SID358]MCT1866228.1 ribosome maturation factor RimM [Dermabacter sp. p3-SID358]
MSSPVSETVTVVVGTIGKAHGLKGEVSLLVRTDIPEERLVRGAEFDVEGAEGGPARLTLTSTRVQQGRWYAKFAEVQGRTAAEGLRGADLTLELDREEEFEEDPDAWYPEELKGLEVRTDDGRVLGTVIGLDHYPAQDLLIVRASDARKVMLPFVEELVPEVDLENGVVLADPPGGLFDPENALSERDGTEG